MPPPVFHCGMSNWHGGRTEVMSTWPVRAAAKNSSVSPATRDSSPFGTGVSTLLLASGSSHMLETLPRSCTSTCSPTRTQ